MNKTEVHNEQEALQIFCKHFNLYIDSMDYVLEESGYYCRLKAYDKPFENDAYYCGESGVFLCYIGMNANGIWMMDVNDSEMPGIRMEYVEFINYIKAILVHDKWVCVEKDGNFIWR